MDSLKTLVDKKNYELVIKLTENTSIPSDLFYRIASFVALNKPLEALKVIEKHREILAGQLPILMKIEIELLISLERFEDAKKQLKYYEELPYFSQEAEERLKSLALLITKAEKENYSHRPLDEEKIHEYLKSPKEEFVLAGLQSLKDKDLRPYLEDLESIMLKHAKQSIRSFTLMTLVDKKWDQKVRFLHEEGLLEVVPKDLKPPFAPLELKEVIQKMTERYKDPVIIDNSISILSSYIIYSYPRQVEFNHEEMLEALLEISLRYLEIKTFEPLKKRCLNKHLDCDDILKLIEKLEKSIAQF
ncbi:MAG: hypothetical protein RBR85_01170 [Bacilli bacterium]|jgi:hypothetical protein|nr:hypothetical protein [Bacilli bacterium]